MSYDVDLDERIRRIVNGWKNTAAKKMFGGICHLLNGNMFCGVYKNFLILRLGEHRALEALKLPAVRPFDITGKPMKGWVMVAGEGFQSDEQLKGWLEQAKEFAASLPAK